MNGFATKARCAVAAAVALGVVCEADGAAVYVTTSGTPAEPYRTWATAATNLNLAVAYAGARYPACDAVIVAAGRHTITGELRLAAAITVRSAAGGLVGASNTVLTGKTRAFNISHGGAVVQGFTITGGQGADGAAVFMTDGTLRDCIIRNNMGNANRQGNKHGGGICMMGGVVSNSIVRDNETAGSGGGIYADKNSRILYCEISGNEAGQKGNGGGICAGAGSVLVRNCMIVGNTVRQKARGQSAPKGGGVYGGTVENCTIVGNRSSGDGGGVCAATAVNSIIYGNTSEEATGSNYFGGSLVHCCTAPPPASGPGNVGADPMFRDAAAGDYRPVCRLPAISPCINAGTNLPWMATARDSDGRPRLVQGVVDIGAFEYMPEGPTILNAGLSKGAGQGVAVRCSLVSVGGAEAVLSLFHGPKDGGTNPSSWANEFKLPRMRPVGSYGVTLSPNASNTMWYCRYFATNRYGGAWAESSSSFLVGVVEANASRRDATEERPAEFVISRPPTATNGALAVNFSLAGGVNGRDFDMLDNPAIIPAGASEVRLTLIPGFPFGDNRPKLVTLTITEGNYTIGARSKAVILTRPQ